MSFRSATIAAAVSAGLLAAAGALAAPASAQPGLPNCGTLAFICDMLPIAPDLEHDVDLTTELPPAELLPEAPLADPCAMGCV